MKSLAFVYLPKGAVVQMVHMFSRTEILVGRAGLEALAASKVAVFGVGGVGSFAAEALARSGIGTLILVDHDLIDLTNLNRQIHALHSTVGLHKVDVMGERIADINPTCQVETHREFFEPEKEAEFFTQGYDYVIDAIDSVGPKVGLIAACLRRHIPIISSMGAANKLDPAGFQVVDISKTYNDPLARVVRKKLREMGITQGLQVVFSPELPQTSTPVSGRPVPGSIAFVPPVAGLVMAGFVVRDLLAIHGVRSDAGQGRGGT